MIHYIIVVSSFIMVFWAWHLKTGSLLSLRLIACIMPDLPADCQPDCSRPFYHKQAYASFK